MTTYRLDLVGDLVEHAGQVAAGFGDPDVIMRHREDFLEALGVFGIELGDTDAIYGATVALIAIAGLISEAIDTRDYIDELTATSIGGNVASYITALRPHLPA